MELQTKTIDFIRAELENIPEEYQKPFNSTYEGYAVLQAQVDDLWDQIHKGEKRIKKQLRFENNLAKTVQYYQKMAVRDECTKVAAMAVRMIQELCAIEEKKDG